MYVRVQVSCIPVRDGKIAMIEIIIRYASSS